MAAGASFPDLPACSATGRVACTFISLPLLISLCFALSPPCFPAPVTREHAGASWRSLGTDGRAAAPRCSSACPALLCAPSQVPSPFVQHFLGSLADCPEHSEGAGAGGAGTGSVCLVRNTGSSEGPHSSLQLFPCPSHHFGGNVPRDWLSRLVGPRDPQSTGSSWFVPGSGAELLSPGCPTPGAAADPASARVSKGVTAGTRPLPSGVPGGCVAAGTPGELTTVSLPPQP